MTPSVPKPWKRMTNVLLFACALGLSQSASAATWYVAPDGRPDGKGTRESPRDIAAALVAKDVAPGDTIELLGGTYHRRSVEQFEVRLEGAQGKPIVIRPAPGARAIIDGGLNVMAPSAYVWIRDLEIFVSEPNPEQPVGPGSHPPDFKRPWGGLHVAEAKQCKFINLVIHDCRQGISLWKGALDAEVYGCIIYDNGWPATDRGHGHAIYTQNDQGVKTIADNIMTGGFSYSMHAYGSAKAFVNNYLIEGNICYATGPFLVGGGNPSQGIRVLDNVVHGSDVQIGYTAPHNEDCEVRNNLIVNGTLVINKYKKVVNEGNTQVRKSEPRPAGAKVIVRPNRYQPGRANIAVLNFEKKPTVEIDAGSVLKQGDRFRLMNPRDFYGKPILEGIYNGKAIEAPIPGEFAAFVLLPAPKPE